MRRLRICVVTGSRSEYGLLHWVIHDLSHDPEIELQLVVTGMHLSAEFGSTVAEIEEAGFPIADRIDMLLSSNTPVGVTKSLGLGTIGFADTYSRLRPDVVLLLGDRFEILAAAQAALIANVPVAHIGGGDTTEGAVDEAIRHSISKMAHLHFVTNKEAEARLQRMGEDPGRIHVVGSPGLDHLRRARLLSRPDLEQALGLRFARRNLLVTFHPETLSRESSPSNFEELLTALGGLDEGTHAYLTKPNADVGGRDIARRMEEWVSERGNAVVFASLGHHRFLSLLAQVDMIVGNSSAGLHEAPSLGKPSINIGDRQKGRLAASSVIHVPAEARAIQEAIARAYQLDCSGVQNPYGDGNATERIISILKAVPDFRQMLRKRFYSHNG
jgi:UDP-hydrolysing UDP-N-acetyl-D-glucosamine 2-epimerase